MIKYIPFTGNTLFVLLLKQLRMGPVAQSV